MVQAGAAPLNALERDAAGWQLAQLQDAFSCPVQTPLPQLDVAQARSPRQLCPNSSSSRMIRSSVKEHTGTAAVDNKSSSRRLLTAR